MITAIMRARSAQNFSITRARRKDNMRVHARWSFNRVDSSGSMYCCSYTRAGGVWHRTPAYRDDASEFERSYKRPMRDRR